MIGPQSRFLHRQSIKAASTVTPLELQQTDIQQWRNRFDDLFLRLDTTRMCDRRTDGQTTRALRLATKGRYGSLWMQT